MKTPHSSWAQVYDEAYHRSFGGFYDGLTRATIECVSKIQPRPARIVDYGAGTGRLSLPLAQAGYSVVAVDPCEEMLSVLKAKAKSGQLSIQTVCRRMQDTLQSPPFDLALCVFTVLLYLLDETELNTSFQSAASVLRSGGHLLLDIPSRQIFNSYSRSEPDFVRSVQVIPETEAIFRYEETIKVLEENRWVTHADEFKIRHWERAQVFDALKRAGFLMERDLLSEFSGSGSNYYLFVRSAVGAPSL